MSCVINASTSAGLVQTADLSGELALQANGTTVATASSSGFNLAPNATLNTANTFGMKNRIINGGMVIDQRNAGASLVFGTGTAYTVDRWAGLTTASNKISIQQNAGAVTPPVGFSNYLGVTSLTAYSVLSTDAFLVAQYIEGFNTSDLQFGTANAQTVTLSFWVYSSLTGTFGGALNNGAFNRSYLFSYSIPTANTWTKISVTIAGDTSGTWVGATNGVGIAIRFGLGAGSTYSGTANTWQAGNLLQPTGTVSVVGTNGATFYVTGVQLEVGTQATSFDFRPINTELAMCQRYFVKSYAQSVAVPTNNAGGFLRTRAYATTYGAFVWLLPVTMRTAPTAVVYNYATSAVNSWRNIDSNNDVAANISTTGEQSVTVESNSLVVNVTYAFHLTGSSEL
jgi:hypothetical protein